MKTLFIFSLILLFLSPYTALFAAPFGEGGFGEEESFTQLPKDPFFIHDTLLKGIILLPFIIAALFIHKYRRRWRRPFLLLCLLVLGFYLGGFLCPLAAVQNVLYRYGSFFLILFLLPLLLSFFRGRLYCSYICPFGGAQELLHLKKISSSLPLKLHRVLLYGKYVLLFYLILRFLVTQEVILIAHSPFKALFLFGGTYLSIGITIITILLSLVIFRPFCQYLCAFGALMGWVASFSKYSIIPKNCNSCSRCTKVCPVQVLEKGVIVKGECLLCGECVKVCPQMGK